MERLRRLLARGLLEQQMAGDVVPLIRMGVPRPTDYSRKFDELDRKKLPVPINNNSNVVPLRTSWLSGGYAGA
jgi:hypothetical protein